MLLYIHIPFCDSKCHYCSFHSYVDKFHLKQAYMEALKKQLLFELKRFQAQNNSIESIFVGGGTPSTVKVKLYKEIFQLLLPYLQKNAEITFEANPNSASKEWLEGIYALGANRISFGVQSFDTKKLKLLNRVHTPQQAAKAIENAKIVGFDNISLDLIYGVMGDSKELLQNDLHVSATLPINHLSAYALTIEQNTPFAKKPQMAQEELEHTKWLFQEIEKKLQFPQYEISNFGTYQSKHNLGYWLYKDYIGIGSGAVGKLHNKRFYPTTDIEKYIKNPLATKEENLHVNDIIFEKIFLGLRSKVGIQKDIFTEEQRKKADILVKEKKLRFENEHYFNNDFLLADEIALFLD